VDIEPTGEDKNVTKIGQDVYQSAEQAEADAKQICTETRHEIHPYLTLNANFAD
jgi:hypothetical protein